MKIDGNQSRAGFKLVELLVVIAVLVVIALLVVKSMAKQFARAPRANCMNNLKQVGLSTRIWSQDHGGQLPWTIPTNRGGSLEWAQSGAVYPHFAVMSNELGTPKLVFCFGDTTRRSVTNFTSLRDSNISYFVVPSGGMESAQLWLAGDRDLATAGKALPPGLTFMTTNSSISWMGSIHKHGGNVVFRDGHVEMIAATNVQTSFLNAVRAHHRTSTNLPFQMLIP